MQQSIQSKAIVYKSIGMYKGGLMHQLLTNTDTLMLDHLWVTNVVKLLSYVNQQTQLHQVGFGVSGFLCMKHFQYQGFTWPESEEDILSHIETLDKMVEFIISVFHQVIYPQYSGFPPQPQSTYQPQPINPGYYGGQYQHQTTNQPQHNAQRTPDDTDTNELRKLFSVDLDDEYIRSRLITRSWSGALDSRLDKQLLIELLNDSFPGKEVDYQYTEFMSAVFKLLGIDHAVYITTWNDLLKFIGEDEPEKEADSSKE